MGKRESLKVFLFAGYPGAYEIINVLLENKIDISGVLFAPENIKRLGWRERIKNFINSGRFKEPSKLLKNNKIPFYFVSDYSGEKAESILKKHKPDILLLYGTKIIKPNILAIPKVGTLNSHSAILPKFRGSRAEFWILYYGDLERAGVTVHWVTPGLDEGDVFLQEKLKVFPGDTPRTLRGRSRRLSGKLFSQAIKSIESGKVIKIPQNSINATKFKRPQQEDIDAYNENYPLGRVKKAIHWFLNSGIQNPSGEKVSSGIEVGGSFNAWFNPISKNFSYVYSEISGYALTLLIYLYKEFGDSIFIDRARLVADWLLKTQDASGAFQTAFYRENSGDKPKEFVTFDAGMVLNGLMNMYRETKEEKYLNRARKTADWLLKYVNKDGSIAAQISPNGEVKDSDGTWSTQSGSYHAKIGIGLINLFNVTKEEKYKKAAIGLCEYALTRQKPDGQFLTYGNQVGTNLHSHAYSAEGLFSVGTYLGNQKFVSAAKKASEWAINYEKGGLVPRLKHDEKLNYNERLDILAQIYRLCQIFGLNDEKTERLKEKILTYQSNGEDAREYGAFIFGKSSAGESFSHANSWVTMFAMQALLLSKKSKKLEPFLLV